MLCCGRSSSCRLVTKSVLRGTAAPHQCQNLHDRKTNSLRHTLVIASQMRNTLDKKRFKFTSKIQNFLLNFAGDLFSFFFHNFLLKETYFLAVQIINFVSPTPDLVSAVWPHAKYWFWVWQGLVQCRLYTMNSQIDLGSSWEWQTSNILPEQVQL